jgi:uncharacterized membrane protein HdeD (DUF308 family)
MSTASLTTIARHSMAWSTALSILIIVAGIMAILVPMAAGIAATILIGWLLVFAGGLHLIFGWHTREAGGLVWGLLMGLVYLAAGIYLLVHPVSGLAALTLILGSYLLAEAILEFVLAARLRHVGGTGWLIFDGIATLIMSILIWATWPSSSPWVIGTLIGVSMIFSGSSRLAVVSAARRAFAKVT